jgi:hypothetical protein
MMGSVRFHPSPARREVIAILFVGIDLAKSVFDVRGVDERGKPALVRPDVPRGKLHELIATLPPCTVAVQGCSGGHHCARPTWQPGARVCSCPTRWRAKCPRAGQSCAWFWDFAQQRLSVDARSGEVRRHHLYPETFQRASLGCYRVKAHSNARTPYQPLGQLRQPWPRRQTTKIVTNAK